MNRTEVPSEFQSTGPTDKQRTFINSLREERVLTKDQNDWISLHIDNMSVSKASEVIERLLQLPKKTGGMAADIPAGRYAVENNDGELRFYQVWRPKGKPDIMRVYVMHGPDSSALHRNAVNSVLDKIAQAGVRNAAIRYGNEIGACSNCGRRLTNRISRELGIGPVCGGRMFDSDNWRGEVKAARDRITARGEDPDEEVE